MNFCATKCHFNKLSDPVLLEILKHLSGSDLLSVCGVSHRFYRVASDECLWQSITNPFPLHSLTNASKKALGMRAIKIEHNFRHSMKPIENRKLAGGIAVVCMDEFLMVTRYDQSESPGDLFVYSLPEAELMHHLEGHTHYNIHALIAKINDTKVLVSICEDQTLRVWSLETGDCVHVIQISQWPPAATQLYSNLAVNANTVVYCSGAHIVVCDVQRGELLKLLEGNPSDIFGWVCLDEIRIVAVSSANPNSIKVWNRHDGQMECSLDMGGNFESCKLHNKWVIFDSYQHGDLGLVCRIMNIITGQMSPPINMAFASHPFLYKNRMVVLGRDKFVYTYSMNGEFCSVINSGPEAQSLKAIFDNGLAVIECQGRKKINLSDINTGEYVRSIPVAQEGQEIIGLTVCGSTLTCSCEHSNGGLTLVLMDFDASVPILLSFV